MQPDECFAFDARGELRKRWPEWSVYTTKLYGVNEVVNGPRRTILIDAGDDGEDWALAHVLAHLDLEHHLAGPGGAFTFEQEGQADWLARIWLDDTKIEDEESEIPIDGEPTLRIP